MQHRVEEIGVREFLLARVLEEGLQPLAALVVSRLTRKSFATTRTCRVSSRKDGCARVGTRTAASR